MIFIFLSKLILYFCYLDFDSLELGRKKKKKDSPTKIKKGFSKNKILQQHLSSNKLDFDFCIFIFHCFRFLKSTIKLIVRLMIVGFSSTNHYCFNCWCYCVVLLYNNL